MLSMINFTGIKCPVCGKVLLQKKTRDKRLYCVTEGCTFQGKEPKE